VKYKTTFYKGKNIVYGCNGNIVIRASLSMNYLYEFNIRELFEKQQTLLSSVVLDDTEIEM
jgi:hypothetical protein